MVEGAINLLLLLYTMGRNNTWLEVVSYLTNVVRMAWFGLECKCVNVVHAYLSQCQVHLGTFKLPDFPGG